MTFQRRIIVATTLLLVLVLLASLFVSVFNARNYFRDQLRVLSEDAATSLAFALSSPAAAQDQARIESMMDVLFDSGYYLSVSYIGADGAVVSSRARAVTIEGVPAWFIDVVDIATVSGRAGVQSGWYQLGEVHVVAHPGFGYRDLWRVCKELFWLFVFAAVFAYGVLGVLLHALARPLKRLERQADAISQEEFLRETALPSEPQFRRVVEAMNRMAERIEASFEQQVALTRQLRREVHMDALTELPNRAEFDARLDAWLSAEQGQGAAALILVSVRPIVELNQSFGREAVDRLLLGVADVLKMDAAEQVSLIVGRRSGSDFALFVPGIYPREVELYGSRLLARLRELESFAALPSAKMTLGIAHAVRPCSALEYLVAADASLRKNLSAGPRLHFESLDQDSRPPRSAQAWLPILEDAIEHERFQLAFQPVFLSGQTSPAYYEVLCRLDDEGHLLQAGVFWPLIERYALSERADRVLLTRTLTLLDEQPQLALSVNIAHASAASGEFRAWLDEFLGLIPVSTSSRLTIELPESLCRNVDLALAPMICLLRHRGIGVCIDRFGLSSLSLLHLQALQPDSVKLDRRFVTAIHEHPENRFYIRSLQGICASCQVSLLVEGVETGDEMSAVEALSVKGYQGYFLGKPSLTVPQA